MAKRKDYSLDTIGKRLSGKGLTAHERVLAKDDQVRVEWMLNRIFHGETVLDIGASDGAIALRLKAMGCQVFAIEPHPAHKPVPGMWWFQGTAAQALPALADARPTVTLCCEVLEHLTTRRGDELLSAIPDDTDLIVTVPNRRSRSYDATKRSRWDWPDHKRHFTAASLEALLETHGWHLVNGVQPIVGTLTDSIWLGAVARRA